VGLRDDLIVGRDCLSTATPCPEKKKNAVSPGEAPCQLVELVHQRAAAEILAGDHLESDAF
jgi:hypothetical protein